MADLKGRKVNVYVPGDLLQAIAEYEERTGTELNLSGLAQAAFRRAVGQVTALDARADELSALHETVAVLVAEVASLKRGTKLLNTRARRLERVCKLP